MIIQIRLAQIGNDPAAFHARVAAFRQTKLDHHKTEGEPAPREHDLVEACVRRVPRGDAPDDYELVDYEVADDRSLLCSARMR
jgi:hypothetical protein